MAAAIPEDIPGLACRPFFCYWLAVCLGTMGDEVGLSAIPKAYTPQPADWGLRFLGTDLETGRPGCKTRTMVLDGQELELHLHLRYQEVWRHGAPLTRPLLTIDRLLALPEGDDFFYLLPMVIPEKDSPSRLFPALVRRLPAAAPWLREDEEGLYSIAWLLSCGPMLRVEDTDYLETLTWYLYDRADGETELDPDLLEGELEEELALLYAGQDPCTLLARLERMETLDPFRRLLRDVLSDMRAGEEIPMPDPRLVDQSFLRRESMKTLYRAVLSPNGAHFRTWVEALDQVGNWFYPQMPEYSALSDLAQTLPVTEEARETLLAAADALLNRLTLSKEGHSLNWAQLPDTVYNELAAGDAGCDLSGPAVTQKAVQEQLERFRAGELRRLELGWPGGRYLVLRKERSGWFCFAFDDGQPQDYALVANRDAYRNTDSSFLDEVPVGLWTVKGYNAHPGPESILAALESAVAHLLSPAGLQLHDDEMSWCFLRGIIHKKERYVLHKRLLGGFPAERAANPLGASLFVGCPPSVQVAQCPSGDLETVRYDRWNKGTAGSQLLPFLRKRFVRLALRFDGGDHLLLLWEGNRGAMAFLRDEAEEIWFCGVDGSPHRGAAQGTGEEIAGFRAPTGLVFSSMEGLRGELELLLARMDHPSEILERNTAWSRESGESYAVRRQTLLDWAEERW